MYNKFLNSQLKAGEYVATEQYIQEPLGTFARKRRYQKNGMQVDEIMAIEVSRETLIETNAEMKGRMDKFSSELGIRLDK